MNEFDRGIERWRAVQATEDLLRRVRYSNTAHAPAGGISIGGKQFTGGEFIPGETLAKATPEEKAKLGVSAKSNPTRKPSGKTQVRREKSPAKPVPEKPVNEKSARAKASHNPSTKEKQDISEAMEIEITRVLGGVKSDDNRPMDVTLANGTIGIEVKTMHDATEHRVNMRKDSRERKEAWAAGYSETQIKEMDRRIRDAKKNGQELPFDIKERPEGSPRSVYTVAVDNRDQFEDGKHANKYSGHKYYLHAGVGAVALSTMQKFNSLEEIRKAITKQ